MFMQKLESRKQIFSNKNITIIYKTLNSVASKPSFQAKICELILMHVFFLFILSILLIHWSRSITISMFVHIAVTIHTSININNPHKQTFTVYLHLPNSKQRLIKKNPTHIFKNLMWKIKIWQYISQVVAKCNYYK